MPRDIMRFLQSAMIAAVCLVRPMAVSAAQGRPKTGAYRLHFPDRVEKLVGAMKGSPATGAHAAPASGSSQPPSSPSVRLGKVPVIKLGRQKPVTREEAARIKRLIASLAEIGSADFGLSPTLSGTVFPPRLAWIVWDRSTSLPLTPTPPRCSAS